MHLVDELRLSIGSVGSFDSSSKLSSEPVEISDTIEVAIVTPAGMGSLRESIDGGVFVVPLTPGGSLKSTASAYMSRESLTMEHEINDAQASLGMDRRSCTDSGSDLYSGRTRSNSSGIGSRSSFEGVNPYHSKNSSSASRSRSNSANTPDADATLNPLFYPPALLPAGLGRKPAVTHPAGRKANKEAEVGTEAENV